MGSRGECIVVSAEDREWLSALGLASVDRIMTYHSPTVVAISGSSDIFSMDVNRPAPAPARIFVKRYRFDTRQARLATAFRGGLFGRSRARFEYQFLMEMRRRGVPAVRPIACGEKRQRGVLRACVLITEAVPDVVSLQDLVQRRHRQNGLAPRERRDLVTSLAAAIRGMHMAGIQHGGLFWRNILVSRNGDTGWGYHFVDPERSGRLFDGPVPLRAVVSDLAALGTTAAVLAGRSDVSRFTRAYFEKPRLTDIIKRMVRQARPAVGAIKHECRRLAMANTIGWLRERIEAHAAGRRTRPPIESVGAFLESLAESGRAVDLNGQRAAAIGFVFVPRVPAGETKRYTIVIEDNKLRVFPGEEVEQNLVLTTDEEAWLAMANGSPDAFDFVRAGRVEIRGDTTLLPILAKMLDA